MSTRSPQPGRGRAPASRPRRPGRLPRRVYWFRRALVLGVAVLLVVGITRLLSYGGGDGDDTGRGSATVVGGQPTVAQSTAIPTTPTLPTTKPGKKGKKQRLVQPEGPCDPSDVLVSPVIDEAHVAQPVRIVLELTSIESPACTFRVAPESIVLRLLDPKRSEPLWTSQDCRRLVPERTVVARQSKPGRVQVLWNGRASDDECSDLTDWVFPGTYTAEAIAVGSSRATSSEFVLGIAVRPTVTRTPTPTATASGEPDRG